MWRSAASFAFRRRTHQAEPSHPQTKTAQDQMAFTGLVGRCHPLQPGRCPHSLAERLFRVNTILSTKFGAACEGPDWVPRLNHIQSTGASWPSGLPSPSRRGRPHSAWLSLVRGPTGLPSALKGQPRLVSEVVSEFPAEKKRQSG